MHLTFRALLAVICTAKFNCISIQYIIIPTKKTRYFPIQHSQTGLSNEARCIMCEIRNECVYIRCRLTAVFNKAVPYLRRLIAGLSPLRSAPGRSTCYLHVSYQSMSGRCQGIFRWYKGAMDTKLLSLSLFVFKLLHSNTHTHIQNYITKNVLINARYLVHIGAWGSVVVKALRY